MAEPTQTVAEPLANLERDLTALARGSSVGRYLILDQVGQGGMGVVYAGYDPELDRRVALKLVRPDRAGGEAARLRLLREAQAIARLSHPNVVAVYDAGTFGEQVFIAMELVAGCSLRQWLAAEPRSWREVVEVFCGAGRGLAAAHAAGLVHRDFKPDNVLVGKDGRPRVVDFGLARPVGEPAEREVGAPSEGLLASPVTAWGAVVGTLAYMAPELLRGQAANAASDQFSFCVALWEALYGVRPFGGDENAGIDLAAVERGEVREGKPGSRVPAWLRAALLKGFRAAPEERFAAMDELLAVLARDPQKRLRRVLQAGVAVVAVGAVFATGGYLQARRGQLCSGAEDKLAGIWDRASKRAVREAFLASGAPFAADAWRGVEERLDRFAAGWVATHRQVCEATRLRGEQSEELLDRKVFCLEEHLGEVAAFTELLRKADVKVVERSVDASGSLSDLAGCTRTAALLEKVPLPGSAETRSRLRSVGAELAAAKALFRSGKARDALPAAESAERRAREVPYPPLHAETLLLLGSIHQSLGEFVLAEGELHRALWAAERGRDDLVKVEGWRELVYNLGYRQARYDEAHRLARHAEAALARAGGDLQAEAALRRTEASVYSIAGQYQEALAGFRLAQAIDQRIAPGRPSYRTLGLLAATYRDMGDLEQALPLQRRAVELARQAVGTHHPHVAGFNYNLGAILADLGRTGEAAPYYEQALVTRERLFGRQHPDVADTLNAIGSNWIQAGQPERALPLLREALAVFDAKAPGTPHLWAMAHHNLGEALRRLGRHHEALEHERLAVACIEQTLGKDSDYLLSPLETIASVYLDQGRPALAIAPLERALSIYERQPPTLAREAAKARQLLARARAATRAD